MGRGSGDECTRAETDRGSERVEERKIAREGGGGCKVGWENRRGTKTRKEKGRGADREGEIEWVGGGRAQEIEREGEKERRHGG